MSYVSYKRGNKSVYEKIKNKDPNTLYWCTDSKELFLGADLYSDGLRLIDNYNSLPSLATAAYGIIYFCLQEQEGYTVQNTADGAGQWIKILDNTGGIYNEELKKVSEKVRALETSVQEIKTATAKGINFRGQLDSYEALLQISSPQLGDLYTLKDTGAEWVRTETEWIQLGETVKEFLQIKVGNKILSPVDGIIEIPTGNTEEVGVVKGSKANNGIDIKKDGSMEVNSLSLNKLIQEIGEELTLNCGTSSK